MKLLSTNNIKMLKGAKLGWKSLGLSLLPSTLSGKDFCPHASAGCRIACLNTAGHGIYRNVQAARMKKSRLFIDNRDEFLAQLRKELALANKRAIKGEKIAVRLNVVSDLPWHNLIDMETYSHIRFYDYTPNLGRMIDYLQGKLPSNYHLTFSRKEDNQWKVETVSKMGGNVAVVFNKVPQTYLGKQVIDGDETDLRFLDAPNSIIGLKAKGKGKQDKSGFVIQV